MIKVIVKALIMGEGNTVGICINQVLMIANELVSLLGFVSIIGGPWRTCCLAAF